MSKKNKKKSKKITRRLTEKDLEKLVNEHVAYDFYPKQVVKRAVERLEDQKYHDGPAITLEKGDPVRDYILMKNFDNHLVLLNKCDKDYRPFLADFADSLYEEFDCKTPSEKALAGIVVKAYYRVLKASNALNWTQNSEFLSDITVNFFSANSKEADRANRAFLAALDSLRASKMPQLNIKVNTQNAFMAQNQQFNNSEINDQQ
jgi:hypothetical protein